MFSWYKVTKIAIITTQNQKVSNIFNKLNLKYQKYIFVEPKYKLLYTMAKITIDIIQNNKMIELSKKN